MVASATWTAAGLLIVTAPGGLSAARVYGTAVPVAMALLLIGVSGVKRRLGGSRQAPSWRAGFLAMWRRLDNVLNPGYDHHRGTGLRDVPGMSTAMKVGVFSVRAGCVFLVIASLQVAMGDGDPGWRPALWFGWFLLYAGVAALGIALLTTDELPRGVGVLLLVGCLPVFQAAIMVGTGMATEPESIGPLVPVTLSTPLRVTAASLSWLVFGAAWAWLGWALWSESADT